MEENKYKLRIKQTIEAFEEIEVIIHTRILNLLMDGEWEGINDVFEIGEEVRFKFSDFSTVADPNVKLILDIYKRVIEGNDVLQNLFPTENKNL